MDWERLHEITTAIEQEQRQDQPDVASVIARLAGIETSDEFQAYLLSEVDRALDLGYEWYGDHVRMSPKNLIALGYLQGVTFARAVDRAKE